MLGSSDLNLMLRGHPGEPLIHIKLSLGRSGESRLALAGVDCLYAGRRTPRHDLGQTSQFGRTAGFAIRPLNQGIVMYTHIVVPVNGISTPDRGLEAAANADAINAEPRVIRH